MTKRYTCCLLKVRRTSFWQNVSFAFMLSHADSSLSRDNSPLSVSAYTSYPQNPSRRNPSPLNRTVDSLKNLQGSRMYVVECDPKTGTRTEYEREAWEEKRRGRNASHEVKINAVIKVFPSCGAPSVLGSRERMEAPLDPFAAYAPGRLSSSRSILSECHFPSLS